MPFRKCRHFDQETGDPIGSGCPKGSHCEFVHPRSSDWRDAPASRTLARPYHTSRRDRDRSGSVSPRSSARMPKQPQWSRHSEHQPSSSKELSARLSEPNANSPSLRSRLNPLASSPSPARESLSSRIRDPRQQDLSLRISEPPAAPPVSAWGAPSVSGTWGSAQTTSSGWGEPGNEGFSWSNSVPQPAPPPPSRPPGQTPLTPRTSSREPSLSSALEPSMQQRDRQPSIPLSSAMSQPAPPLERQSSRSRPVPPPQQSPPLPPPQPQQPPPTSLPPPAVVPSSAPMEGSRPINQRAPSSEVAETKNASQSAKQRSVDVERMMDLCKASMQYMEYHKAGDAVQRAIAQKKDFKPLIFAESVRQKIHNKVAEADVVAKKERTKWDEALQKIALSWPSVPPSDSRLEDANRQLQGLKHQVQQLEEILRGDDTQRGDSLTVEQIITRQTDLAERLEEVEEHQADVENDVEQHLDGITQRHRESFEKLYSNALIEVKESATVSTLLQEHMDQLSKKHEAFAEQITQIYNRQADILHRSQILHEENEELKRRLAVYEERDARFHSELQVAVQALDMLKQQSANMQGRTDQLANSLKTIVMAQTREHIEKQFIMVKEEIGQHLQTTKEVFTKDFRGRYGPVITLLEQLTTHLRNSFNEPNQSGLLN